ncbi:GNAT family N-acetyltransferase [Pontibacter sp. G13]|uniref:GNAT family N-acetyltransferase n=1 Tax=Pontibacter sp. G13 TaxID=3074898 RepID=UPI0028894D72|nr:GNAT family N-acetyltransferase [Pontibacter sp. G13]WNJ16101.1 GNAT family N-acetyltransferase [Pontibacter sp. G13]
MFDSRQFARSETRIEPLDRYNWELVLDVSIDDQQAQFVPPVLYTLAQAQFEQLKLFGIRHAGQMVGMITYGNFGGICWINRILIDVKFQRQGIGRAALEMLLAQLQGHPACHEIRTSYAKQNYAASQFFRQMGFVPIEPTLDHEVVAKLERESFE